MCDQNNVRAIAGDNIGQNTDNAHAPNPRLEIKILDPTCPPLWAMQQHERLSRSGPRFDPWSGQVSWVRFFWGFSSPVRQMSGSFRPPKVPEYHLAIIIIITHSLRVPMT